MPIYNVDQYLKECLDSLISQTFTNFEVICINDGSTDNSRQIIQEYIDIDKRFKVIDKPNSGYGASMNQGLKAATGEYIAILESDDFFQPTALQDLYFAASTNNADVAKADFCLYWSIPTKRSERFNWVRDGEAGVTTPLKSVQVFYRKPSIWSAIYNRAFLEENQISFLETPGASYQDAGFNFKVWASAETIVLLDEVVLSYRQDNESSSVNSPGKVYCVCDEYQEMVRFLNNKPNKDIKKMSADFGKEDALGITNYKLFEPWKKADRKAIIADPIKYHENRHLEAESNKLKTAKRLYRNGGLSLVAKTAFNKLVHK